MKITKCAMAAVLMGSVGFDVYANVQDSISGIFPKLASYNLEGECGTGAVVPWAGSLWYVTYAPHEPYGSSDKLYQVTSDKKLIVSPLSIGGTPANRLIHKESNQLLIGPYVISADGKVRVIPWQKMPGRLTGTARHLTDPKNKVYIATMEEGFYEVDVNTLDVRTIYPDGNGLKQDHPGYSGGPLNDLLPGVHGKGLYSGQGHLYFTNNGEGVQEALTNPAIEAGVLAEWDGKDWNVVRRNQYVEVTGPGGILGNANADTDPIWATGWDHKSVTLGVRYAKNGWTFYRLPKASHSYDGAHGWNTEWPRIRNVGTEGNPEYLMTMHGMFWHFPQDFPATSSKGIRPGSAYLKVIGDFTRWGDDFVFGCDDTAQKEFLNSRKIKGHIVGPGQSCSNLWFVNPAMIDNFGPTTADGSVWLNDDVKADKPSEPMLVAGWPYRTVWLENNGNVATKLTLQTDNEGKGKWNNFKSITLKPGEQKIINLKKDFKGEWMRVVSSTDTKATAMFSFSDTDTRKGESDIFRGLAKADDTDAVGALLWSRGDDMRTLSVLAEENYLGNNRNNKTTYYEMPDSLKLNVKNDITAEYYLKNALAVEAPDVKIEELSVLVIDDSGRRWRLPISNPALKDLTEKGRLRTCREVSTERDLLSLMGTFYELPAENADGFARIRPVASHPYAVNDYCSYRGMLVMSGVTPDATAKQNRHIIMSENGKGAVWAGVIDDLWSLGKPVGKGGPWNHSKVSANVPSDPYLFGFYDKRGMKLSNEGEVTAKFRIQLDPDGSSNWMDYESYTIKPEETVDHIFPVGLQARWLRIIPDADTMATALLTYE